MTFDLTVLATPPEASDKEIRAQAQRCTAWRDHPEGDLDLRIVTFYKALRGLYPDDRPALNTDATPWASTPLSIGIDHVTMHLRHGPAGNIFGTIHELVALHDLVVYDPHDRAVTRPDPHVGTPGDETS